MNKVINTPIIKACIPCLFLALLYLTQLFLSTSLKLSTKFELLGKYKNTAIAANKANDNKQQNLEKPFFI